MPAGFFNSKLKILLFIIYAGIAIGTATQNILISGLPDKNGGLTMKYNNYLIFKYSYFNLIEKKDIYKLYPEQAKDYFKYSPSFALFFGIIAYLPDAIGLNLWSLLNTLFLFFSILYLVKLNENAKILILLLLIIELITSVQNSQSNALVAGLLVLSFGFLERGKLMLPALFIVLTIYIKLFGILSLTLFLFYPHKWKLICYSAIWFILLFILPLFVVGWDHSIFLYQSWFHLLQNDHVISEGLSLAGLLNVIFRLKTLNDVIILIIGLALLLLPLLRIHKYHYYRFRLWFLSSVLLWMVLFNFKAESPTFIIAMTGIAIWYFSQELEWENLVLLVIALVMTSLSSTDMIPVNIRINYVDALGLKVVPSILIWSKITYELTFRRNFTEPAELPTPGQL